MAKLPEPAVGALPRLRLALYQPDRPHNFGSVLRLGACFGTAVEVIEPCGFPLDDRRIRQAALDYADQVRWARHPDFAAFEAARLDAGRRLVLLSTAGEQYHHRTTYLPDDILMLGSEGGGVPETVHRHADLRVRIPLQPRLRSLNVAMAGAIVLVEALRQTGAWHEGAR
jgi:tRNA (cytidine/uridine-2'-O-)-methyltransferase